MAIYVKEPGFATSVQDLGRYGYSHLGISPAGAADKLSYRIANLLVGNEQNVPALEMTLAGATLEFDAPTMVAIGGAECAAELDGAPVPMSRPFEINSGSVLRCGRMTRGTRAYLAIQGGFHIPLVLGSAATDLAGRFGGFEGRFLRKGDQLEIAKSDGLRKRVFRHVAFNPRTGEVNLRLTRGAQMDWFGQEALANFFSGSFCVTNQWGRTGLRLQGAQIITKEAIQLLTEGVPLGAIQVPPDGQPIVLFVDQQTTGGYPKIANVISADMHLVGQLQARDVVRFTEVSIEEAVRLLRDQESWLKAGFQE